MASIFTCTHNSIGLDGICKHCRALVNLDMLVGEAKKEKDLVNNPPHYTHSAIECIDAIEASMSRDGFIDYCKGNVIKYLWRFRMKGASEDIEKAGWYMDRIQKTINKVE